MAIFPPNLSQIKLPILFYLHQSLITQAVYISMKQIEEIVENFFVQWGWKWPNDDDVCVSVDIGASPGGEPFNNSSFNRISKLRFYKTHEVKC